MYLISHFFNEEFLLPFWLKHHVSMFDHGVMIDYGSTDRSVEIIRELAPDWEIRPTKNEWFVEPAIGKEVMEVEEEVSGWKMVLNTTEFVLHHDLRAYAKSLGKKPGIRTTGVIVVDHPEDRGKHDYDELLVAQKTHGYFEVDVLTKGVSTTKMRALSRCRLLHQQPNGMYTEGRHTNQITGENSDELFLCWFGWSPFTQEMKGRKEQIQHKTPEEQKIKSGWKEFYCVDDGKLEEMYLEESGRSYDLLTNDKYRIALQQFLDSRQ